MFIKPFEKIKIKALMNFGETNLTPGKGQQQSTSYGKPRNNGYQVTSRLFSQNALGWA
jgi:hypothetical protein